MGVDMHSVSTAWVHVQMKLHAEDPDQKEDKLDQLCDQVTAKYSEYMEQIFHLWDKPEPGSMEFTEYNLRQKEREMETNYIRTIKALDLGGSMQAPRLEGRAKTPQEVQLQLHRFEELLWILQQ